MMVNKLLWKGIGLTGLGILIILWWIIKIIASIIISIFISNTYHLTGNIWWASTIIIFSIICKILFYNNKLGTYKGLIEDYKKETLKHENDTGQVSFSLK